LTSADAIQVAIVDDDVALLNGLSRMIDAVEGLRCVGTFTSAEAALATLPNCRPDVLLLDIGLPGISGSDAVIAFRQARPSMAILMLTVYSDRPRIFASICNGANGYLLKATPPPQVFDAIRSAHSGGSPLSPEIARDIVALFQKIGPSQPCEAPLAAQEQRLLWLLSEGHSYEASARRMNVSINTVRNYIRSIYEKLHVHTKSAAVKAAIRQGLIE
jgi:DNA-binding NarL/FixJ family response regulator